jgi:hypothetical protein
MKSSRPSQESYHRVVASIEDYEILVGAHGKESYVRNLKNRGSVESLEFGQHVNTESYSHITLPQHLLHLISGLALFIPAILYGLKELVAKPAASLRRHV